jgi:hypothetical protein
MHSKSNRFQSAKGCKLRMLKAKYATDILKNATRDRKTGRKTKNTLKISKKHNFSICFCNLKRRLFYYI